MHANERPRASRRLAAQRGVEIMSAERTSKQALAVYSKRLASAFADAEVIAASQLAEIVERDAKTVRAYMRRVALRDQSSEKHNRWGVTQSQATTVAEHFAEAKRTVTAS